MFEIVRQFFDKKSPIFIITIAFLISAIISLAYDIDDLFKRSQQLRMFEKSVIIIAAVEIVFKTLGMEIFKRTCPTLIEKIHFAVIIIFIILNIVLYAWAVNITVDLKKQNVSFLNEPHQYFMQVYVFVMAIVYLTIFGLFVCIKLQNKTMTVLNDEQKGENNNQDRSF